MSMMFDEPIAAPPPPIAQPLRTYKITVRAKSGQSKEFSCEAQNFVEARKLLAEFKEKN
jgi:hypothetical protein